NTAGFSTFIKLPASGSNTPGCSTPTPNCFYDWGATTAQVSVNGRSAGTGDVLPDSGIVYMIVNSRDALAFPSGGACPPLSGGSRCAPDGTRIQVSLPGMDGNYALYGFRVGGSDNPFQASAVEYFEGTSSFNTGVGFYGGFDYVYDPVAGFVGYRWN